MVRKLGEIAAAMNERADLPAELAAVVTRALARQPADRYQRASEPIDDRWVGANPPGHTTAGKRGRIC